MTRIMGLFSALILCASVANAAVVFNGQTGPLAASATFEVSGSQLLVTLTNTSSADVLVPADVLAAVFFRIDGTPSLAPVSGSVASGSVILWGPDGGGDIGGEWAYAAGLSLDEQNGMQGIGTAGFGLFGPPDMFPGPNLSGPVNVDGLDYGLLSAGDDPLTGNAPVTGGTPLAKASVTFVLQGLPTGFDESSIGGVTFQYGTSLDEPRFGVPEPATMGLLLGMAGLGLRRRLLSRSGGAGPTPPPGIS